MYYSLVWYLDRTVGGSWVFVLGTEDTDSKNKWKIYKYAYPQSGWYDIV